METATQLSHKVWECDVERLREIIEMLPIGVVLADAKGALLFHNRAAHELLGAEDAARGGPAEWSNAFGWFLPNKSTLLLPEELPLRRALRGEEVCDDLIFVRNRYQPDGIWISATSRPMRDRSGRIHSGVMLCREVADARMSRPSLVLLSQVVEQIADGVLLTDKQGVIEYVNPAFETITGFSHNDVHGKTSQILRSGVQDTVSNERLSGELSAGRPFPGATANRKKTGEIYHAEETITAITDEAGKVTHFLTVMQDATEARNRQEHQVQLRLARQIQQKFYGVAPILPGFDVAGAAYPAYETSGDYFDFIPLANNRLCIAVGDVEGHGFGSALVMALTRAYVHSFAAMGLEVDQILTLVNRMLVNDLGDGCFVTLMLACLDVEKRSLVYAGAGHVPGYVLSPSGPIEHTLESSGPPVGLFPEVEFSRSPSITLQPGELLVLLTDGITESEAPGGGEWGAQGALSYLCARGSHTANQLVAGLYHEARRFAGNELQRDDITSVVVRVNADHQFGAALQEDSRPTGR